ncbi:hypothetical protein H6G81_13530 [Scytonema hofmannii FACHB-248]|uniref:Secreted protein n=1 Tax=Scytonema hofmannii FACHB-248 TaxID=1842502 RepID=A0ABR8GQ28_9CYAN|nr:MULTISPECIES: hypothetical protein [Nostocales]MBD2605524.1 hypothetical protein [Scytonema hofmannii FACHB-248]
MALHRVALALCRVTMALYRVTMALCRVTMALHRVALALYRVTMALCRVALALDLLHSFPNTPPPTPPRLRGGERLRDSNAGWGSLFLIYARGLLYRVFY